MKHWHGLATHGGLSNQKTMEAMMIPLTKDVAALIGEWAEAVENRSLLHEKFALPKCWNKEGIEKVNDAGRWSVLRIVTRGSELLKNDASRLRREASGRNADPHVASRKQKESAIADKMANIARPNASLQSVTNTNSRQFLSDLSRSFGNQIVTFEATLGSRMLVNLAGGVIENAGISLDRCFGLPFIPGSAVKGIARNYALWDVFNAAKDKKSSLLRLAMVLFGYGGTDLRDSLAWAAGVPALPKQIARELNAEEFKGCACFLPAYITSTVELVVDMVNTHYADYYSGRKKVATDNEKPMPNYFPAVEAGCSFGFAVLLNRIPCHNEVNAESLLAQAKYWLQKAVTVRGVGAKTGAGYGWFELGAKPASSSNITQVSATPAKPSAPLSPVEILIQKWQGKLKTKDNFPAALPEMAAISDNDELRKVFESVIPENERQKRKKNNPYWQAFTSGKHAETGKKILLRLNFILS